MSAPKRWWPLRPQGLVVLVAGVASARIGLRPISDNSTLVHLKTGIELLRTWHVPRHDPYSFTAAGHAWVVQSWLASLAYGAANAIGHHALVTLQALLMGAVGIVTAIAARSSTTWRSGVAALVAICASSPDWSPRPLMVELLCLGLVIVIAERRLHPAWLIPVVWLWVNTHGSWPVGLAWLAAWTVGSALDRRGWPRRELRYIAGFAGGLVVSLLNPIGPRLLAFPLVAFQKRSTFKSIVEWRSPNFQDANTFLALIFIAVALLIVLRLGVAWAEVLPVCGFFVAAMVAERNLAALGVVLAPALGQALARPQPHLQSTLADVAGVLDRFGNHPWWRVAVTSAAVIVLVVMIALGTHGSTLNLREYPVRATDYLASTGRLTGAHRIAAADVVGDYLIWRAGPATKVFIDDRYDMYPAAVTSDAAILNAARGDAATVLDKWKIDTVLWAANQAVPGELEQVGGWQQTWTDGKWDVLERTGPA
jgi:hypothetical protein